LIDLKQQLQVDLKKLQQFCQSKICYNAGENNLFSVFFFNIAHKIGFLRIAVCNFKSKYCTYEKLHLPSGTTGT
jgi:hypothetical protein